MKLNTKLKIILIISLATVLLISIAFALATWRIHEARQKQEISQKIIKNFFDINTVVYDYLLYHEERPQIQWRKKNEAFTEFLAALKSDDPEEKALLEKIRRDHESMKAVFSQLTTTHNKKISANPGQRQLLGEMEERLILQLMTKSREIAIMAAKLEDKGRAMETRTEVVYDGFIYIALVILVLTMAANSYLMIRGVVKPIVQLHQGTEIIGAGNLDHRVGTTVKDEIGQLSRAFDAMTEKLKSSLERYRNLFEQAPVGVAHASLDGLLMMINPRLCWMLGYPAEELIGRSFQSITHPDDLPDNLELMKKLLTGEIPTLILEKRYLRKDGSILWANITATLARDIQDKPLYFVAVVEDITERKAAVEALQASEKECRFLATQLLAAEEKERNRIAQELHDGVGQMLSAIKYRLEIHLEQKMELPLAQRRESLGPAVSLLQESTEEIRRICMALRPSTLDDLGILATVNWFCREFQKIYPEILIVRETAVQEEDIPPMIKTVIFRTFQEAFNNAAKHSRASRVCIALRKNDGMLELMVEDDGQGFDLEAHRSQENHRRGIGLGSMKERVELSGGIFTMESAPGKGTFVRAVWPLEAREEDLAVRDS